MEQIQPEVMQEAETEFSNTLAASATANGNAYSTWPAATDADADEYTPSLYFSASVYASQACTLNLQQSRDGTTWRTYSTVAVTATTVTTLAVKVYRKFVRTQIVNGSTIQSLLEVDDILTISA